VDGDEAITVDLKTLQNNEFVLNPSRYLEKTIEIEDGVELGSLMKRITRGAPLRASELDEMVSDEPTDTQYLMLANIQNGMISEDLPYLKELDAKLDKYCIGNRNLLLSKNGAPFKVAVAEVEEGRKILGNGNLFIIELDEEKVNPYFIKAFFDSEVGAAVLKSIVVGATIPNISAESLKKLIVPLPSMEKQNEIANLYQAKQDEIKVLQLKIQKAQNDLRGIFEAVK
jgi:type I restriction enzyme M protein